MSMDEIFEIMPNDRLYYQEINRNIAAIINGFEISFYHENEREDLANLSTEILPKKLKKLNDQLVFYRAENRLLYNYLTWYEKKILQIDDVEQRPTSQFVNRDQIGSHRIKQPLSIDKKRDIAEVSYKVLLTYSQKYEHHTSQYVDECINTLETNSETINHLELELMLLRKYLQQIKQKFISTQKRLTVEEFLEFFHERIRHRETLTERKHQKSVRLRFNLNALEKTIRKVHQIIDTVSEVDFEQLKIDIEKQLKELNMKNKMLIFYKRQQSEANMKFNMKKPELFNEIRTLTSIRNATNTRLQQLNHFDEIKRKLQAEINEYEKLNEPLRQLMNAYRVPSINNYVDLKSKQIHLHRQRHAWERKVQIAEREYHLRQTETIRNPEKIIHPWKYLQNPSPILYYHQYKTSSSSSSNAIHDNNQLNISLPKLTNKTMFSIIM